MQTCTRNCDCISVNSDVVSVMRNEIPTKTQNQFNQHESVFFP